jgi:ABC-type Fe3+-hydroxamate transport system substrate-binding protein
MLTNLLAQYQQRVEKLRAAISKQTQETKISVSRFYAGLKTFTNLAYLCNWCYQRNFQSIAVACLFSVNSGDGAKTTLCPC